MNGLRDLVWAEQVGAATVQQLTSGLSPPGLRHAPYCMIHLSALIAHARWSLQSMLSNLIVQDISHT